MQFLLTLTQALLRAAAYLLPFLHGKSYADNKTKDKVLENVEKANRAERDDSYDDELRKKYRK